MADVTLSGDNEITFDLSKMTIREYRGMFDPQESQDASDATMAKVAGLTLEEVQSLPFPDYKRLAAAFFKSCREPLTDPNA